MIQEVVLSIWWSVQPFQLRQIVLIDKKIILKYRQLRKKIGKYVSLFSCISDSVRVFSGVNDGINGTSDGVNCVNGGDSDDASCVSNSISNGLLFFFGFLTFSGVYKCDTGLKWVNMLFEK